jgi:D-beta-D-heptose 7-phosphate kinase/D-beta-D-heptose 1-phosphate adenosyltransferase
MSAVRLKNAVLVEIVKAMHGVCVAVLGDPMLDYYHFGRVERLSPEAPCPIFVEEKLDLRDGGAHNVAANLAGLGCHVIQIFPPPPWTMKHRYLVGAHQLFRIDRDKDHSQQTHDGAPKEGDWRALVISDYAKGWCTTDRCQEWIAQAKAKGVPVIVDPKGTAWGKYHGATFICPNEAEYQAVDKTQYVEGRNILHKRGAAGIELHLKDSNEVAQLEHQAKHVYDVTGAGDTVVAVFAAAQAVGCSAWHAASLANIAAGVVVGQVGTFPISAAALLAEL